MRQSKWSPCPGSNRRPRPYQGRALPSELHGRTKGSRTPKLLERETGFEPATPSLEGWRSTAELFPPLRVTCASIKTMVGRGGFEPPKAYASRFTVCPLWPLGYLPESAGTRSEPLEKLALAGGFEPPTHCLQGSCSATELRQHRQNFTLITKPYRVKEFESLAASGGRPRSRKLPRLRRR